MLIIQLILDGCIYEQRAVKEKSRTERGVLFQGLAVSTQNTDLIVGMGRNPKKVGKNIHFHTHSSPSS